MPTLYESSKKLRRLPDSVYGNSRKLASISLARMATADDNITGIPSGVVIDSETLERKVKVFLIKINNIGTYLSQIPTAVSTKTGSGRGQRMVGGGEEELVGIEIPYQHPRRGRQRGQRNRETERREMEKEEKYMRQLMMREAEEREGRFDPSRQKFEEEFGYFTPDEEEEEEEGSDEEGFYNPQPSRRLIVENEDQQDDEDFDLDKEEEEKELEKEQLEELGLSSKYINFNALFGRATQAVDDATIYFNENIAPYKRTLSAVQIENINRKLDEINVTFVRVANSSIILSLSKKGTYQPYDQLYSAFKQFRISVRSVINSAVSENINNSKMSLSGEVMDSGSLTGGSRSLWRGEVHRKNYRQELPTLSILGKYKNCSQKFLL